MLHEFYSLLTLTLPSSQYTAGTSRLWLALTDSFSAGSRILKEAIDALGEEDKAVLMDVVKQQSMIDDRINTILFNNFDCSMPTVEGLFEGDQTYC